jgi:hypothetical protein
VFEDLISARNSEGRYLGVRFVSMEQLALSVNQLGVCGFVVCGWGCPHAVARYRAHFLCLQSLSAKQVAVSNGLDVFLGR